jgi:hypothetical protein
MPIQRLDGLPQLEEEITQPRGLKAKAPAESSEPIKQADPRETLTVENYDPENLKRILAQAQAEAGTKARRGRGVPLSIIVALIVSLTIIGVAVVIALLS